ncbi:MAG: DEAD/DEAH box helicase [Candidatus ainarchaeum sp.]|nr:DEAD/DEAH box helicase [Candidatus ainarchaeum sp.]
MPSDRLLSLMREKGFTELTEVQRLAIPAVETGENCLVLAPTGYGKTECALLPIFDFILGKKDGPGIIALYITPLKALNRDMMERVEWWSKRLGITVSVRHGDTSQSERAKQARHPPQLLITTPETLQAILPSSLLGAALKNVEKVVVDEVHELYPDKRGAQLAIALERLREKREGRPFQRIGLSATVGSPEKVAAFLCGGGQCRVVRLKVERAMHLTVDSPVAGEGDYELGAKLFIDGPAAARLRRMDSLISSHAATLAFVNTRSIAETLTSRLRNIRGAGGGIAVHHGSLSKDTRLSAEARFKGRELSGLVTTSSLELGIDIGRVDLVVQYSSPRQVQRLVQRVGRSGHSIEKTPKGVIIATDEDDVFESAVIARRAAKGLMESEEEQSLSLDVLAHQMAGMLLDRDMRSLPEIVSLVSRAHPFSALKPEQAAAVARQLHSEGLAFFDEKSQALRRNARTRFYYYENLSMIPDQRRYFVKSAVTNSNVAMLDEGFVANFVDVGATVIMRGVPWKVLDIGEKELIVEPSEDISAAVPDWVGEEIPVPFEVAQEVGALRRRIAAGEEPCREFFLSKDACEKAKALIRSQSEKAKFVPDEKTVFVEETPDAVIVHSLLGTKGNESLSRLLSALCSLHSGSPVKAEADPYRVILQSQSRALRAKDVAALLKGSSPDYAEGVIRASIAKSNLFRYKFVHVAKAFGLIAKDADYKALSMRRLVDALSGSPIHAETMRQFIHDYLDFGSVRGLLGKIRSGEIGLHAARPGKPSPIARLALAKLSAASELIAPIEPASEILKSFRHATLAKQAKLCCTYCHAVFYRKLSEIPANAKITCPNCSSPLVATVDARESAFPSLQRKLKEGKKNFSPEERKLRLELQRTASLVQAYGRRAVAALSVYGVGAETASRVLQRLHRSEDLLFVDLLEAQKQFIRTKRYWQA